MSLTKVTYSMIQGAPVNVLDFGAVGDGVTDDTAAIQAAYDHCASISAPLAFLPLVYKITAAVNFWKSGVTVYGNGATLDGSLIAAATAYDQIYAVKLEGSIAASVACTVDLVQGENSLTMGSTASFAVNDLVFVSSTEKYPILGGPASQASRGSLHEVARIVSGTVLQLRDGVFFSMAAASDLSIAKVTPVVGANVYDLNVVMGGSGKAHCGFRLTYTKDSFLRNCSTAYTEDCGVRTVYAYGGGVVGGSFSHCTSPADGGSGLTTVTGYGVNPGTATRDFLVQGAVFKDCRHSVAGGGSYPAIACQIVSNTVHGGRNATYAPSYQLDCHEDCLLWVFDSNTVNGDSTSTGSGGILVRGNETTVTNNTIANAYQFGIYVRSYEVGSGIILGATISGNRVINSRLDGIVCEGSATHPQYSIKITGNTLNKVGGDAITLYGVTDGVISGNYIKDQTGTTRAGIRLVGTAQTLGNYVANVVISDNVVSSPTGYGVRTDFADKVTLANNLVIAAPTYGYFITSSTRVSINGGDLQVTSQYQSAVYLNSCVGATVTGLTAKNTHGAASSTASGVLISGTSTDIAITGSVLSTFNRGVYSTAPADYITVAGVNARTCTTASVDVSASPNTAVAGNL